MLSGPPGPDSLLTPNGLFHHPVPVPAGLLGNEQMQHWYCGFVNTRPRSSASSIH